MNKPNIKIGDRIVVMGRNETVKVCDIQWSKEDFRYKIIVDWGVYGKSRVWDTDEGKIWYRYSDSN